MGQPKAEGLMSREEEKVAFSLRLRPRNQEVAWEGVGGWATIPGSQVRRSGTSDVQGAPFLCFFIQSRHTNGGTSLSI